MKKDLLRRAINMNRNRKYRKGWQTVVRTLAAGVVFCTTYVLILPAITMQENPVCGFEAHEHTDACYSQPQAELTGCNLAADAVIVHQHGDLCRNAAGDLICTLPEKAVHVHGDGCYTAESELACPVTHVHSDACMKTEKTLICTLAEAEGHSHGESCSGVQTAQVCEKEVHAHGDGCYEEQTVACQIPESEEHIHSESCNGVQTVQVCEKEVHAHGDGCYEERTAACQIPETEGHAHTDACYTVKEIICTEPTAADHAHEESCWKQANSLTCGKEELQLHSHAETCFDAEGNLICTLPVVVEHIHTEACLVVPEETAPVLTCTVQVHTHTAECYPLDEDEAIGPEYHCGFAAHEHDAVCYNLDGTLKCTIPVHTHDTLCLIDNLDLTADVETKEQWEATLEEVELTGVWADDLIAVAESQLGYTESKRNCILYQEELLGYNRYGAWYGNDYGKWDDMFVSFCLNYAEIDEESMPRESDTDRWVTALTEKELYQEDTAAAPVPGDLVFVDTDEDEKADFTGIVVELLPENEIKIIAGDTENNSVAYITYKLADETILGFGKLPENPDPENAGKPDISAMLAQLPEADQLKETLRTYQNKGDKAGFENELKTMAAQLETIGEAYNALSAEEKAQITGVEKLTALMEICITVTWQEIPALTMDAAMISALTETAAEIVSDLPAEGEEPAALHNQDSVTWQFSAGTASHDQQVYSSARVKMELVLPLTADKAVFDTAAMTWLEDSKVTMETRTIGENRVNCQVLTGTKQLLPTEESAVVIPGSFGETVKVNVLNAAHGDQVFVQISAAMEQNAWNGTCWLHQTEEKQTIQTTAYTVNNTLLGDDEAAVYDSFRTRIEAVALEKLPEEYAKIAADEIHTQLDLAYVAGELSHDHYIELYHLVWSDIYEDPSTVAERAVGQLWKYTSRTSPVLTPKKEMTVPMWEGAAPIEMAASPMKMFAAARNIPTSSDSQIIRTGGSANGDNVIYVSKTIDGTEQENVFDITLNITTVERIEEVVEEPNMAVVVVMDISNTMNSKFPANSTSSRYDAAMTAAEQFLNEFQQNAGEVSRVGYVAFNTNAHEIFDLSRCDTPESAAALIDKMKNETKEIIYADGYASSHTRFTNIEAGLKMGADMLKDAPQANKYIIFLSDGFPTTYVDSGYDGYDPYCSSGTVGNDGVFYDGYYGVYCSEGTSYSETAAVKARDMAKKIKADGINIFSIGVDVGGQTIKYYHDSKTSNDWSFSIVERPVSSTLWTEYEIGTWDDGNDFKLWLQGSDETGIGSGYYYDSTNVGELTAAYEQIFAEILRMNAQSAHTDWVVTDPMHGLGVEDYKNIEFIGFWEKSVGPYADFSKMHDSLTGTRNSEEEMWSENTVTFDEATKTIRWDLKKSTYYYTAAEGVNNYVFQLVYRVRLENENADFVERMEYNTNDTTSMKYRLIEVTNSVPVISPQKSINFPLPSVEGYLAELNFQKVDPLKNPIPGAEFTLSHDTVNCGFCRGDGSGHVVIGPFVKTSGTDGIVTFTKIPSGHSYTLTETKVPEGYIANTNTYNVKVAYDNLTVIVTDQDGNVLEWTNTVENTLLYHLPNTGSIGTSHFTFGGFVLIGAAALMYICISGHKRKRGGAYRSR